MATEIELKLAVGPEQLDALLAAPPMRAYALGAPSVRRLTSTYYDTPDHQLAAAGVALRVRRFGDRVVQTVKSASTEHAVERGEWEADLPEGRLDPSLVPEPELRARIEGLANRLEERFVTDFDRATTVLRLPSGTELEVAVDRGELRAGDAVEPIHEVELELRSGSAADLWLLARWLHRTVPFRLGARSKAARGFALRSPPRLRAVKAPVVRLDPELSVEQAFKRIGSSCLSHLRSNERCAFAGTDVGGVHQMRVAARRLRSALSLFRKVLPPERTRRIRRRLRWLAAELADSRAWDVFATETLAGLRQRLPKDAALAALTGAVDRRRVAAYVRVRAAVGSPAYTRLLLDVGHWLAAERWPSAPGEAAERLAAPILPFATEVLDRRRAKVMDAGRNLRRLRPKKLHQLRIELKKLRYAANFLGSLFPAGDAADFNKSASNLQDALGYVQDVADTPVLLEGLAHGGDPLLARAIGAVAGWQAAAEERARRVLPRRWKVLRKRGRFWAEAEEEPPAG